MPSPRLRAAFCALVVVILTMTAWPFVQDCVLHVGLRDLISAPSATKDLGLNLQRKAFEDPHVLPLYGSSELVEPMYNRPDLAFHDAPTGFRVCPIGQAGNTCLAIAEKLAALGPDVRDHKVAILLSASWFRRKQAIPSHYAGNFSYIQAVAIARNDWLGQDLTHRFARRMLEYPDTLKDHPALATVLRRLSLNRCRLGFKVGLQMQMLALEQTGLATTDKFSTVVSLACQARPVRPCDNVELPIELEFNSPAGSPSTIASKTGYNDDHYEVATQASTEWKDFELLLDTLKQLQAKPLIIAIPIDGKRDEAMGTSATTRNTFYYQRLAQLCAARDAAFEYFPEHDHDPSFLINHWFHPTAKGWAHINRVLDAFCHNRPWRSTTKTQAPPTLVHAAPPPAQPSRIKAPEAAPAPKESPNDDLAKGKPGDTRQFALPNRGQISFCYCPPGTFTLGSAAEEAGRDADENAVPVRLTQGFWLARTEFTKGQWTTMRPLPSDLKRKDKAIPVTAVSWTQVDELLTDMQKLFHLPPGWKVALPTEAQWEYACRAGTTTPFNFGSSLNGDAANCYGDHPYGTLEPGSSMKEPSPPGHFKPNAWGLYDMHGNVWEWCADWYAPIYKGGTDPRGAETGFKRVIRGGSWGNFAVHCRSAYRNSCRPAFGSLLIGFRPALVFTGAHTEYSMRTPTGSD